MTGLPTVVGVDGCRAGWVAVERSVHGASASLVTDLQPLFDRVRGGDIAAMAIDMPIGLLDADARTCDIEARKVLGPRRSSVFPAPVRAVLDAVDYDDAQIRSRAACGKGLSKQAFNLVPKIREVDGLILPDDQHAVVEAHPECAFVRLAGRPLPDPKRTEQGRSQRLGLLADHDPALAGLPDRHRQLPVLDLIDAAVLTITARHVVQGTEIRLGSGTDRTGLGARIVY